MKCGWISAAMMAVSTSLLAQTCTTQAKLPANVRQELSDAALAAGQAIKNGDSAALEKMAAQDLASNFNATAYLARTTSEKVADDSLVVDHLFELDANSRVASDTTEADFSCPLSGTASETDFAISGLPKGLFAFAMVEAQGPHPWLIAMLFREDGGAWKLAGLYPHARTAAGRDGLWYWTDARAQVKAGKPWVAWLEYGEADELLRPANFATSTSLDALRDERSTAAPPELKDGVSKTIPYAIKATDGTIAVTSLGLEPTDDGSRMNLLVHVRTDDAASAAARNAVVAKAIVAAHPELRAAIAGVTVFGDVDGQAPVMTTVPAASL